MVIGDHGSLGENVLLPVGVEKGHACVSVIPPHLVTVAACVQETPPNYPGVMLRPVQVSRVAVQFILLQ